MVANASHGIFLADGSGHFGINCKIFTASIYVIVVLLWIIWVGKLSGGIKGYK